MKEDELRTKIKKLISLEEKRQIYITYVLKLSCAAWD